MAACRKTHFCVDGEFTVDVSWSLIDFDAVVAP
jgi:hypothetical protein